MNKLLELIWEDKMSEGSLTLPHEFSSATLVPRPLFRVGNHMRKYQTFSLKALVNGQILNLSGNIFVI